MPPKKPIKPKDNKEPIIKRPVTPIPAKPAAPVTPKDPVGKKPDIPIPSGETTIPKKPVPPVTGPEPSGKIPVPPAGGTKPKDPVPAPDDRPAANQASSGKISRTVFQSLKESNAENLKTMNASLSEELKQTCARSLRLNGYPELANLLAGAPAVDFSRSKDIPLRQWVLETLSAKTANNPQAKKQLEEAASRLPEKLTLGELLGLDTSYKEHPLFRTAASRERLSGLFSASPAISPAARTLFINTCENFQGTGEEFWKTIKAKPEFSGDAAKEAERLFQLDILTRQNLKLVQGLESQRKKAAWKDLRDLASWDTAKWTQLVSEAGFEDENLLSEIEGANRAEKISGYVQKIRESLRLTFPNETLRRMMDNESQPVGKIQPAVRKNISKVLLKAQDLDLENDHLENYFTRKPEVLAGIENPQEVKTEMRRIQRVFRIVPDAEKANVLLSADLDSAHAIADIPWSAFSKKFSSSLGGEVEARAYYDKAGKASAASTGLMASIGQAMTDVTPAVVGVFDGKETLKDVPTLANLFGSMDLCDCKHCASVYGPAAYLVDLLQFLRKSVTDTAQGPVKALDILRKRRPDLEHLKLTCENTLTALPYVDLVNEILEFVVVQGKLDKTAVHDNGGMSAEELNVNPQYVNDEAYEKLAKEIYPAALPFNRPIEISRGYLEHLGSSRYELMKTFRKAGMPSGIAIACEYLKIDETERKILTGETNTPARAFYGYSAEMIGNESWTAHLSKIPIFLRKTGLSFSEVVDLLKTRFVNADKTLTLDMPAGGVDLEKTVFKNATAAKFEKIHRFIRLRRKLGWKTEELDSALTIFCPAAFENAVLEKLSIASRLMKDLRIKLPQLLSFWANLETYGENPLYARLFLNKAVINPIDPAFRLNSEKTQLLSTEGTISEHTPAFLAALGVNAQDFAAIRKACGLESKIPSFQKAGEIQVQKQGDLQMKGGEMTLQNISKLYRHALLAKVLRIPVGDFLSLKGLTAAEPFADPAATLTFVEKAQKVRKSKFKPTELDYILRHTWAPERPYAPTEETAGLFLRQLHQGLKKIWDETILPEDPSGEILAAKLPAVISADQITTAMGIIDGSSPLSQPEKEVFIDQQFSVFVKPQEAKTVLLGPSNLPPDEAKRTKIAFVLRNLMAYLRDSLAKSSVIQMLAERFGIEAEVMWVLVNEIMQSSFVSTASLMTDFLAIMETLPENLTVQIAAYRALHKISILVQGFGITPAEASYLQAHKTDFSGFDWNAIPMSPETFKPAHFIQWERLFDLFSFRDRIPQSEAWLTDIFSSASTNDALENLRKATGWDEEELAFAAKSGGLALEASDFKNEAALIRLESALQLAGRIGLSVKTLFQWSLEPADTQQAKDIVQTVRAKYDEAAWLEVGKSLNDKLREMQREALVAYVMPRIFGVDTANQMFEYFLIDVSMNPVMKTSRIKQAISSVQTFIQRCLMNLENEVAADAIDEGRWEWMKNYRVWEANRKVFLYPENWIEPELRDDKTPFFRELEAELLQNDITLKTSERAFLNYLEKLDEVARLQMCGMYHHVEEDETGDVIDVMHCFGRTFNSPSTYYYRSYTYKTQRWTPWQKLTLDIEGEQLIPIVFNRRLYIFWPIFEQKSADGPKDSNGEVQTRNYWQIKLAWSEFLNDKWTAKKTTKDVWTSWPDSDELIPPAIDKHFFQATVFQSGESSVLDLQMHVNDDPDDTDFAVETTYGGYVQFYDRLDDYVSYDHGDDGGGTFTSAPKPEDSQINGETYTVWSDLKIPNQEKGGQVLILDKSNTTSRLLFPHEMIHSMNQQWFPFFFQDKKRVYFVRPMLDGPEPKRTIAGALKNPSAYKPFMAKSGNVNRISLGDEETGVPAPGADNRKFENLGSLNNSHPAFKMKAMSLSGGIAAMNGAAALEKKSGKITIGSMVQAGAQASVNTEAKKSKSAFFSVNKLDMTASFLVPQTLYLHFETFFHPHTLDFIRGINRKGIPGLLTLENQKRNNDEGASTDFELSYGPTGIVHWDRPREIVDFEDGSPYAIYNWELFFHIPLLIASSLVREGRYDDAFYWFHMIFNPMTNSTEPSPRRYWNVLPFYANGVPGKEQIQQMLKALAYTGNADKSLAKQRSQVQKQVYAWRENPFNPHLIARMRVTAYQKNVVMKYIDALIGKADQLFAMDTIETINEAAQIYVLAANLLGPKPETIPAAGKPEPMSFDQLKDKLDHFSNALVQIENEFPFGGGEQPPATMFYNGTVKEKNFSKSSKILQKEKAFSGKAGQSKNGFESVASQSNGSDFLSAADKPDWKVSPSNPDYGQVSPGLGLNSTFYFCIPKNEKLLSYWDLTADRLFKIRHGLNIEGIERPLALFEPPIDPALLVRARAMGLDLTSVLGDLRSASPRCRFSYLIQKAFELCAEVKSLGNSLLSALEKKDAEELAQVRQRHEVNVLKSAREVKKKQIEESRAALSGLQKQRDVTNTRYQFYKNIAYRNSQEDRYIDELEEARDFQKLAQGAEATGGQLANIPDFTTGSGGMGPVATTTFGGSNLAKAGSAMASAFNFFAGYHMHSSTMAQVVGGWHRRWDEWKLQEKLAAKELVQIDKQILGAEIRIDMGEKDLENHDLQISNAEEIESFLSGKFTSRELYSWMVSRISSVYFQVYKLAYDLAKKAERAWQMEFGRGTEGFINFGYWDSLKKGLLAGEEMWLDLKRMESASMEMPRDYELTKNISLLQMAPMALVALKETGTCEFRVPEEFFVMDFPGHYNRRIKSVSVTIPCVTGPYTSVNGTLTLLSNEIRVNPSVSDGFSELEDEDDARFLKNFGPVQSIATSSGQNDSGVFELNFRDERYLPFEGSGAVSRWRFELKKESNAFDLSTVSDVILKMSYKAREGGEVLARAAREAVLIPVQENLTRLFSAKHEFSMEWHRFLNPLSEAAAQKLELPLTLERFPFYLRGRELTISGMEILLKLKPGTVYPGAGQTLKISVSAPAGTPVKSEMQSIAAVLNGIPRGIFDVSSASAGFGAWTIQAAEPDIKLMDAKLRKPAGPGSVLQRLKPEIIEDMLILVKYSAD